MKSLYQKPKSSSQRPNLRKMLGNTSFLCSITIKYFENFVIRGSISQIQCKPCKLRSFLCKIQIIFMKKLRNTKRIDVKNRNNSYYESKRRLCTSVRWINRVRCKIKHRPGLNLTLGHFHLQILKVKFLQLS